MQIFRPLVLALLLVLSTQLRPSVTTAQGRQSPGTAASRAAKLSAPTLDAAKRITAEQLRVHLTVVASDAMEGRATPSRGLDATADYLAAHLKRLGLKPAGDGGTYFQRIALGRGRVDQTRTTFELNNGPLKFGEDFLTARAAGAAEGAVAYVGHGWVFKSKNIDAYQGLDVRDKILVVSGTGLPKGVSQRDLRATKPGEDWEDADAYARRNGARGIIRIPNSRNLERWWRFMRNAADGGQFRPVHLAADAEDEEDGPNNTPPLPTVYPSARLLDALFAGEGLTGADALKAAQANEPAAAFALSPQKRAKFTVALDAETVSTQNVVATLEGSDSALKSEYVALGAHYDHVGRGVAVNGDNLYNGADDDGSGTVAVLALAEAFVKGPRPRRSVLFVWHAGEEHGLWGSDYFTRFPTVPVERIVAQLNMDMIGRSKQPGDTSAANRYLSGPDEIYVIGSKLMSTELGALSERVNRSYLGLSFNYRYDEPNDPEQLFSRSDHFNYARRGIPIIFYFDGVHEDYHQPSDTVDKIDFRKLERVTRTIFVTAAEIANAPARPLIDKQLPRELTGGR